MRLLLDTHVAIWAVDAPDNIPRHVQDQIIDAANQPYFSMVSIWEIAIKTGKPWKGDMPFNAQQALDKFLEAGFLPLGIKVEHILAVEKLPFIHADPFDRLLIAQALTEPMRLVSTDGHVAAYSDTIITW